MLLARRREAVQQRADFAQRQRVDLNGVGVVIPFQPKLLQHPRLLLERERAQSIEVGAQAVKVGEEGHGNYVRAGQ